MPLNAWLTPDAPASGFICRRLLIPDSLEFVAIVTGALNELIYSYNFEKYGALTPDDAAALCTEMFDKFCLDGDGGCRMVGEIIPYAGDISPRADWLVCDGSSLLVADYPDLFNIVADIYGSADMDHFNIPDLRGRIPIGFGTGTGLSAYSPGQTGGEEAHVLTTAEIPSHAHDDAGHLHAEGIAAPSLAVVIPADGPSAVPGLGTTATGFASIQNTGGDSAHNTIQPYLAINYLIVAK